MKDSHIQFYALLLLSDMKWEVASSTLCALIFFFYYFFFLRNLYINLHMAGLHFISFTSLIRHHSHANTQHTQAHVNQIGEEFMTAAAFNRMAGSSGRRKQAPAGHLSSKTTPRLVMASVNKCTLNCGQL